MDAQRESLRRLFDAVSDSYDQVGVDFFQPIAEGLVIRLDPRRGERAHAWPAPGRAPTPPRR